MANKVCLVPEEKLDLLRLLAQKAVQRLPKPLAYGRRPSRKPTHRNFVTCSIGPKWARYTLVMRDLDNKNPPNFTPFCRVALRDVSWRGFNSVAGDICDIGGGKTNVNLLTDTEAVVMYCVSPHGVETLRQETKDEINNTPKDSVPVLKADKKSGMPWIANYGTTNWTFTRG